MSKTLISGSDFEEYKSIPASVIDQIDPYIIEAQIFDIKPLLDNDDEEFLQAILNDMSVYQTLIDYIRPVLVYYAYGRFLIGHGVHLTPSGVVEKENPDSRPVSDKRLSMLVTQTQSSALYYQNILLTYLENNRSTYPLWKCSIYSGRRVSGARIKAIGGNSNIDENQCNESWNQFETL